MMYSYQAEKISAARHALLLSHPNGEAESIASAFLEISLALDGFDATNIDEDAQQWIATLQRYMDTSEIKVQNGEGAWAIKASTFTHDDQAYISNAVDELAHWFSGQK